MASTKRYFAGIDDDKVRFRASSTFFYRSLTYDKRGAWMGFSSAPPGRAAVREISKASFNALVALKAKRVQEYIATRVAAGDEKKVWDYSVPAAAGGPVLRSRPVRPEDFASYSDAPENSWVSVDAVPPAILAEITGAAPLNRSPVIPFLVSA